MQQGVQMHNCCTYVSWNPCKCCLACVQARDVAEQRLAAKTAEVVQLRTALIQAQGKVRRLSCTCGHVRLMGVTTASKERRQHLDSFTLALGSRAGS